MKMFIVLFLPNNKINTEILYNCGALFFLYFQMLLAYVRNIGSQIVSYFIVRLDTGVE